MSERIIRVKSCTECPHFGTRWHSKEPTYYCEYNVTGQKQEDYGEELNILDLIPLFCPLEKASLCAEPKLFDMPIKIDPSLKNDEFAFETAKGRQVFKIKSDCVEKSEGSK